MGVIQADELLAGVPDLEAEPLGAVGGGGFDEARLRGHSFVETDEAGYTLGIMDRAIDVSRASGRFGDDMAAALKVEARGRVGAGTFFGHIAYVSLAARKPA